MFRLSVYCFTTIFALAVWASGALRADTITLVADPWCPYNCQPDSAFPGILIEVAQRAFERSGHAITYKTMPWTRAIKSVRVGRYDGIVGTGPEETPDFVFTDREILSVDHTFFVRRDDTWRYRDLASLARRKLGVVSGYSYGDLHHRYVQPHAEDADRVLIVTGSEPLERLLEFLVVRRIDTLIEDRTAFRYNLRGREALALVKPAGVFAKETIYIAFSPANERAPEYARILSRYIAGNGAEIDAIIGRYVAARPPAEPKTSKTLN